MKFCLFNSLIEKSWCKFFVLAENFFGSGLFCNCFCFRKSWTKCQTYDYRMFQKRFSKSFVCDTLMIFFVFIWHKKVERAREEKFLVSQKKSFDGVQQESRKNWGLAVPWYRLQNQFQYRYRLSKTGISKFKSSNCKFSPRLLVAYQRYLGIGFIIIVSFKWSHSNQIRTFKS